MGIFDTVVSGMTVGVIVMILLPHLPLSTPLAAYSPLDKINHRRPTTTTTQHGARKFPITGMDIIDSSGLHNKQHQQSRVSSTRFSSTTSLWSTTTATTTTVVDEVERVDIGANGIADATDGDNIVRSSIIDGMSATTRTTASTTPTIPPPPTTPTTTTAKSYLDDGFVFGLNGSGLERPKGKQAQLVVEGDSLETQPWQVALVWGTLLGHSCFLVTSVLGMVQWNGGNILYTIFQATTLFLSSWTLADFGSGVLHWSVDNYGNGRTPIMGGIIAAFQGHHSAPWTITQRGFANNVCKLCIPFGVVTVTLFNGLLNVIGSGNVLVGQHYGASFFFTVFCLMEILSQEFHKWSHTTKGEVSGWVNTLQKMGWTIGRKPHAQHHIAPYDGNYCIISGVCNPWLDKSGFFRRLEHFVYRRNGIESNAWKLDPALKERTLRGEYQLPI
jgi:hypothetical protein